jgi:intein/homing endonuclease
MAKTLTKSRMTHKSSSGKPADFMPKLGKPTLIKKQPQLTIKDIVNFTPVETKQRSKDIRVRSIKRMAVPNSSVVEKDAVIYKVTCNNPDNRHDHDVTIIIPDGTEFSPSSKARIDCSCPSFVYHSEYALAKRYGNAYIWRCNGEAPVETNPGLSGRACLHKDTPIATNKGFRPIQELMVGDKVETAEGKFSKIIDITNNGIKKCVTLSGRRLVDTTVSLNHPLMIYKNGQLNFIKAKLLREGDLLVVKRPKVSNFGINIEIITKQKNEYISIPKYLEEDLCFLLGFFSGDGSVAKNNFKLTQLDRQHVTRVRDAISRTFGVNFQIKKCGMRGSLKTFWRLHSNNKEMKKELSVFFKSLGLKNWKDSAYSRVPDIIFRSDNSCKASFIDGYWTADGSICDSNLRQKHASCMSISYAFCKDIQKLLLEQGIFSSVISRGITGYGNLEQYDVRLTSRRDIKKLASILTIKGQQYKHILSNSRAGTEKIDRAYYSDKLRKGIVNYYASLFYTGEPQYVSELAHKIRDLDSVLFSTNTDLLLSKLKKQYPSTLCKLESKHPTHKGRKCFGIDCDYATFRKIMTTCLIKAQWSISLDLIRQYIQFLNVEDTYTLNILTNPNREYEYVKISKISEAGRLEVYDMEIEDPTHTYLANGIINHNCKHTLAAFRALNNRRKEGKLPTRVTKLSQKLSSVKD